MAVTRPDVTLSDVEAAAARLAGVAHHTPVLSSTTFGSLSGGRVSLKAEHLQRTGSFKIRGAYNMVAGLDDAARAAGVVAASAGNHAQGLAIAARMAGAPCTIVVPEDAPLAKVVATRGYGAVVEQVPGGYDEAAARVTELVAERRMTLVPAFDAPDVVAGQGTVGLEIAADLDDVDCVLVPVGGGGLASGIAVALAALRPTCAVIGVQATGCAPLAGHFHAEGADLGEPAAWASRASTIADGIAVKTPGTVTWPLLRHYLADIVTVDDDQIAEAIVLLMERAKCVVEGAGAVGLAALLSGATAAATRGRHTCVVLSGGNIDATLLERVLRQGLARAGRFLTLESTVRDRPGELSRFLDVVAATGANVLTVEHHRETAGLPVDAVELRMTVETRNAAHAREVGAALAARDYAVTAYPAGAGDGA